MRKTYRLREGKILRNAPIFAEGLEKIFGFEAEFLEMTGVKKIYSKAEYTSRKRGITPLLIM